ncbi:hypothetical protein IFM89_019086 [Coptis chinensis]|uniref:Uncharacterized protein n=1 Tax=Coptis chinensis TaxID=261450 RepID=A0A835HN03_9MAGN|nr:hypothetical protein IFM89_019086 [Coptis chinensis]
MEETEKLINLWGSLYSPDKEVAEREVCLALVSDDDDDEDGGDEDDDDRDDDKEEVLSGSGKAEVLTNPHRPYGNNKVSLQEIRRIREAGGWMKLPQAYEINTLLEEYCQASGQSINSVKFPNYLNVPSILGREVHDHLQPLTHGLLSYGPHFRSRAFALPVT